MENIFEAVPIDSNLQDGSIFCEILTEFVKRHLWDRTEDKHIDGYVQKLRQMLVEAAVITEQSIPADDKCTIIYVWVQQARSDRPLIDPGML